MENNEIRLKKTKKGSGTKAKKPAKRPVGALNLGVFLKGKGNGSQPPSLKSTNQSGGGSGKGNGNEKDKVKVPFILKGADGRVRLAPFGKTVVICLCVVLTLTVAVVISVNSLISYYYGLVDFRDVSDETTLSEDEIDKIIGELESGYESVDSQLKEEVESNIGENIGQVDNIRQPMDGVINILLVGLDNSGVAGDKSQYQGLKNTDAMIVLSINEKQKRIVLTSILRDTAVEIIRKDGSKTLNRINTACIYGGYNCLFDTIDRNFAIDVDKYVEVNFMSFVEVVNIVGGVDLELRSEEIVELNNILKGVNRIFGLSEKTGLITDTTPGVRHLNGLQALSYARIRKLKGSDFGRTERQRKIIMSVAEKAKGMNIAEINRLCVAILKKVSTNLTQSECTSLMSKALEYLTYDMYSASIPKPGTYKDIYNDMLQIDFVQNYKMWKKLVLGEDDED